MQHRHLCEPIKWCHLSAVREERERVPTIYLTLCYLAMYPNSYTFFILWNLLGYYCWANLSSGLRLELIKSLSTAAMRPHPPEHLFSDSQKPFVVLSSLLRLFVVLRGRFHNLSQSLIWRLTVWENNLLHNPPCLLTLERAWPHTLLPICWWGRMGPNPSLNMRVV